MINNNNEKKSNMIIGCMRMNSVPFAQAEELIETALELGLNHFDHADIYGKGECEKIFSKAIHMSSSIREKIILQSKCGIREGFFDFSKEHIITSVDGILKRLETDYLDMLLLHRPDALVEPEEVADAFNQLKASGKVRSFGVSNQNPAQISLLQKYVGQKIVANQLQFSITNSGMIQSGINVNMENESAVDRDGSILDYCRLNDITIQAWSPFQYGFFEGIFLGSDKYPELNKVIDQLSEQYNVTNSAIAISWILRHPAKIQPIIGSMNPTRLRDIEKANNVVLTRQEWYAIYRAAGNVLP